jgi:enoyl-CoA hydratase/carnithine racemase
MAGETRLTLAEGVATITLTNPSRLNAIDEAMALALAEAARTLGDQPGLLAAVIRGEGERAFSAGMDLKHARASGDAAAAFARIDAALMAAEQAFAALQVPVIGVLRGACYGAGVIVASWADLRIGADDVRLGIPAVANSLFYPVSSLRRLERLIGLQRVRDLFFTGAAVDARTLQRWAFLDRVVARDDFSRDSAAFIAAVAAKPVRMTRAYKRIFAAMAEGDDAAAAAVNATLLARSGSV